MSTSCYTRKYVKKDGTISEYKQSYKRTGRKPPGRPVCLKTKIRKLVEKLSDKNKQKLYNYLLQRTLTVIPNLDSTSFIESPSD